MSAMVSSELFELITAGESQTLEFKATFDKASIESLVKVGEFPVKPVSIRGRYFKRVASSNHQLNAGEIADLYMQSLQLSWDAYEARGASLEALSPQKVQRFIRLVNENGRFSLEGEPIAALQKLNYIVNDHPTWAAMLLFAKEPLRHHIHIGRFKTPSTIIDDRQITDTLFEAVDQAMKFIVSHISVGFEFDGGIQRKERFGYPLPALREVLLNAVVHRSYTDPNDIQIKIFDDKITIFSPGTFYNGISVADIQADNYRSSLRNKLVAEGFYLVNAIEKYGSGFIRIRNALKEYPEIDFEIKEFTGGVMVTFAQKRQELSLGDPSGGVSGGVSTELNNFLELIRSQPGVRVADLANQTG